MQKSHVIKSLVLAVSLVLAGDGAANFAKSGVAQADSDSSGGGGEIRNTVRLTSTGVRPNAAGRGRTRDRGNRGQRIDFELTGLNPNAPYRFVADDVELGTRTSNANGAMEANFRDGAVPDELKPVRDVARLEVYTGAGDLALFGDL